MRLREPLDHILGSTAKVRALRFLCRRGGEWSGRRLAAHLSLNPVTAHRALRELYEATLLDFRKVGGSHLYSLRPGHYLVKALSALFERESGVRARVSKLLVQEVGPDLKRYGVTAVLYGSVARGEERPTSDLDILLLVRSAEAKQRLQPGLERFSRAALEEFGNAPALYVNTLREAAQKLRRRLPVFENILRDHRLLWGRPLEEVLRAQAA